MPLPCAAPTTRHLRLRPIATCPPPLAMNCACAGVIPPLQRGVNALAYRLHPAPAGGSGSGGAGPPTPYPLRSNQHARAPGSGAAALVARAAGGDPLPGPRPNASRVRLDEGRPTKRDSGKRLRRGDGRQLSMERGRGCWGRLKSMGDELSRGEGGRGSGGTSPG